MIPPDVELDPEARANRRAFHLCLPLIFLPVLSWPLVLMAGFWARSRNSTANARFWRRMIAALVVVDLLAAILVVGVGGGEIELPEGPNASAPRLQIGVFVDPESNDGARIVEVQPGLPAERAGLEVGDLVHAVDGLSVTSSKQLSAALDSGVAGEERELEVDRGGIRVSCKLVPRPYQAVRHAPFERMEGTWTLRALGVLAFGWLLACRHGTGAMAFGQWAVLIFVAQLSVAVIVDLVLTALLGGESAAGYLIGALASMLAMFVAAAAGRRHTRPAEPEGNGSRSSPAVAVGLGVLYLVTLLPRTFVLSYGLDFLTAGGLPSSDPWYFLEEVEMSTAMLGLILLAMVIVGPITEELVFRGFFLPWLVAAIGRTPALLVTSIAFGLMHYAYGPFVLVTVVYGFVFGWARLRSKGLLAPVVLHIGVNLIATSHLWLRWESSG